MERRERVGNRTPSAHAVVWCRRGSAPTRQPPVTPHECVASPAHSEPYLVRVLALLEDDLLQGRQRTRSAGHATRASRRAVSNAYTDARHRLMIRQPLLPRRAGAHGCRPAKLSALLESEYGCRHMRYLKQYDTAA
jgi:hypothetical protein